MRKLSAFEQVSLDGRFVDGAGDMSWAHKDPRDAEWNEFVGGNASSGGALLFGRVTYEMMARYWPTPLAAAQQPAVAEGMNRAPKYVCSRTLQRVDWSHATLLSGDLARAVHKLKESPGPNLTILGSGSIVAQLSAAQLIDEYQLVVNPLALGSGRTIFDGLPERLALRRSSARTFANGNVVLCYEPQK